MPSTGIANNINCLGYFKPKQNHVAITHGFRLTFFQWSADKTNYSREICEHLLTHKLPNEVEATYLYLCSAFLEKRKCLMADWEIFCNLCD